MSDPANGTIDRNLPADPVLATDGAAPADVRTDGVLQVGQRWRDLKIEAVLPDAGSGVSYLANHIGLLQQVLVWPIRIADTTEWRRRTWEQLRALPPCQILTSIESYEEGEWRYEVTAAPPATSMRDWIACHRPSAGDIVNFTRQMAEALGCLHGKGVVHLNLRPETIYVDDSSGEPRFLIGGTTLATLYAQPDLIAVPVNPFYAPPEAAGLVKHTPGGNLRAWDWWSLGRVVQEFLLGRHVLGLILDRDVSRVTPELAGRAEMLLLERDPPQVRPGALDYMPEELSTLPLLRGLLTSSQEGRWGLDAVQRSLRRETVKDHYDLPRNARFWSWGDRIFTVDEAADFFTKTENWEVGEDLLFLTDNPHSLAHFLKEVPAYRADWDRLQAVCELTESAAWEEVPVIVRRTITAAASWLSLGVGAGGRAEFRVCGYACDLNGLPVLFQSAGPEKGTALFRALVAPPVVQFVESLDGPAARVLKILAANAGRAMQLALARSWIDRDDAADQARMIALGFLSGSVLRERVELLCATYATNSNPMLAQMMAGKSLQAADLIVLVHLGQAAEKNGFITHERWRQQRSAALKAEGEKIVTQLTWIRAHRLLATSRLWGASSTAFATVVLVLTAFVGWTTRSVGLTALVPVLLLFSRGWMWWRLKHIILEFDSAAAPWKWTDGAGRSASELKKVMEKAEAHLDFAKKLRDTRAAIADVMKDRDKRPQIAEPQWWDLWLCLGGASLLTIVIIVSPLFRHREFVIRPVAVKAMPTPTAAVKAPAPPPPVLAALNGEIVQDPDSFLATGKYEILDDGFGRRLRGPLARWDRHPPDSISELNVASSSEVLPEQIAYARVSGGLLMAPYGHKAVRVLLALRVPTNHGFGIVLYNTRDRELYERQVYYVRAPLSHDTWYQFGRYRVLFLESPVPPGTTISLAPP